jgi:ribokinase
VSELQPLKVDLSTCRYQALIGTGGIGAGLFFALNGNHTLGREESRSGHFLDQRDYCKLHIIAHYVAALLPEGFETIPLGMVGEDEVGAQMVAAMRQVGMDTRHVQTWPGERSLTGICFLYPDGSGGNLTPDHSASHQVSAAFIAGAAGEFARFAGRGIALSAPEVPLEARQELLVQASRHGFLRAASFTSGELHEPAAVEMLAHVDLLSINIDEAAALSGEKAGERPAEEIARAAFARLRQIHPSMQAAITAGRLGSWAWQGERSQHLPALPAQVVNTAGAGDSFLAGLMVAHVVGLDFWQAQQLATLIASLSTTSPHTIHPELDRRTLRTFARQAAAPLSGAVARLLEE